MTWELLLVFLIGGAVAGIIWAYTRRKHAPYDKSLSQIVREPRDRDGDAGPR